MSRERRDDRRDAVTMLLASRRVRLTRPRRAILGVLSESASPLSAAEIHTRLVDRSVNLVSVYRTLHLMRNLGLLRMADASRGVQRFELAEPFAGHHHHLICRECGSIEDLEGCLLEQEALAALSRGVRRSRRFRVTDHDLSLFGICGPCDRGRPRNRESSFVHMAR
jgi:Fe2+ or Zn2+ uptake regulation protein